MTYLKYRSRKGASTILISSRIQLHTIEFADEHCFVFGRFINTALETFVHDLQTDYNVHNVKYWLTQSGRGFIGYDEDKRGSVAKMIRVRADIVEYLKQNNYQVNTAINLACDRWRKYYKEGNVADWAITRIIDKKKKSAREMEKLAKDESTKMWNICGNCRYWQPQNRQSDEKAICNHSEMKGLTFRWNFCEDFAAYLENNQTTTK